MIIDLDDWDMLPTQRLIYTDTLTETIVQSSGLGAGKSHGAVRKALQLSALNRGFSGGFLCPTYKDFKKDIKPLFEHILEDEMGLVLGKHYWFHKSDFEYRFIWNKKPLYIFSGENPIAGPNLAYALINEYSLIKYERINEMLRRVRVKDAKYKQKILVGTPEDIHGWLEEFVENMQLQAQKIPNFFKIHFSDTSENTHVDANYRRTLETLLDDQQLKIFASGQIVKLGTDYFYYSYDRKKNTIDMPRQDGTVHVGLDFNVGRMHAIFANVFVNNGKKHCHVFDELVLSGDSNTYTMADALLARYSPDQVFITCDAAGANRSTTGAKGLLSDISILRSKGFKVRHKSQNTSLRYRQLLMNGLLFHGNVTHSPNCRVLARDLEKVRQNKVDFNKIKANEELTHASDALDYLCDFEFVLPTVNKPKPLTATRMM
jgi:hypothetical protein